MARHPALQRISVFIDSSVLFAGSLSASGSARQLILAGASGSVDLVVSSLVLEETRRNLVAKAPRGLPFLTILIETRFARITDPAAELVAPVSTVVELKDAPIVAAALAASVNYLITYDRKHLLSQSEVIQKHYGPPVATPDALLAEIEGE
jgi:predicted nucleic acid-binding protein